jgi:hypothetical protein
MVPQVGLLHKGQAVQIIYAFNARRADAGLIQLLFVEWYMLVTVGHLLAEPLTLQQPKLRQGQGLYLGLVKHGQTIFSSYVNLRRYPSPCLNMPLNLAALFTC